MSSRPVDARVLLIAFLVATLLGAATANGSAPPQGQVQLVLPLKVDAVGLRNLALAVSTPGSGEYGRHQSVASVARRFGASQSVRRRVLSWLRAHGAASADVDATGSFVEAVMPLAAAARAFGARVTASAAKVTPRVPGQLAGAVTAVFGLDTRTLPLSDRFDARGAAADQPSSRTRTGTPAGCGAGQRAGEFAGDPTTAAFTPNQYLTAYGFDPLHQAGLLGQNQRVALVEIDSVKPSDVRTFARCFGLRLPPLHQIKIGGKRLPAPGGESTLDVEVLDAAAPDVKALDLYEMSSDAPGDLLRAVAAPLQRHGAHPQVISVSLGLCELGTYLDLGPAGFGDLDFILETAALSGSTVVAAAGDTGSAGCQGRSGTPLHRLAVDYPASSSFVTAVGGTNLLLAPDNHINQEIVWNDGALAHGRSAGGGGFSAVFPRPSYQDGAVTRNARAVPDVSLLADRLPGYAFYCTTRDCPGGGWHRVGGTSAAAPLFGGGLALIDQDLQAQGKQYLGLVNPLLYAAGGSSVHGAIFNDVTQGSNDVGAFIQGGGGNPLGCCTAGPGYDEASGWGSVNFANLAQLAAHVQAPDPGSISVGVPLHQHPVRSGGLLVRLKCSRACFAIAGARIEIDGGPPFQVGARVHLTSAGSRTVRLRLTGAHLRKLRAAEAHRTLILAIVYAELTDSSFKLLKLSTPAFISLVT